MPKLLSYLPMRAIFICQGAWIITTAKTTIAIKNTKRASYHIKVSNRLLTTIAKKDIIYPELYLKRLIEAVTQFDVVRFVIASSRPY